MKIRIASGFSNIFWIILAVAVVGFCGYSFLTGDLEHIEDTNGPDNYALATITDENIIKQDIGSLNLKKSSRLLSKGITFSSDKFSGVYRIFHTNLFFDSGFLMNVIDFEVKSGNFRMVLVNDGRIVAEVEPDMMATCQLDDLNGSFELIIAGESAEFEFSLDGPFCEQFGIEIG